MKTTQLTIKFLALILCLITAIGIALFPMMQQAEADITNRDLTFQPASSHQIEIVFVLDTTSSMSGLIHAAKEKIWSIASTMASAQQNPDIKMGLVAFRDRGDDYVTKVFDLSDDLDTMYANLMDLRAQGGGDGPESVNQALYDAIHKISWSHDDNVYKASFLVGDAPPHMDYPDDIKYPVTLATAKNKGIIVNTIQSGQHQETRSPWQEIAALGLGEYFHVKSSGNTVAVATPFDQKLVRLSEKLESTRLYYGDEETKVTQTRKLEASKKIREELSIEALARRSSYNVTPSGKKNFLGESELVEAVSSGKIKLEDIDKDNLPKSFKAIKLNDQMAIIKEKNQQRIKLKNEIQKLSQIRNEFIKNKLAKDGDSTSYLDDKIYEAVKKQSAKTGLRYDSDSAKY